MEAKHSEVLKDTEATISCVVSGLTKKLDAVAWEKSGGGAITHDKDGYKIADGDFDSEKHSQTTVLTVPKTANTADSVYTCVITSNKTDVNSADKTNVNSNIFSKYDA